MDLAVVCTGNACRSPIAAAFLQARLAAAGVPVTVTSAGLAPVGSAAYEPVLACMAERGLDLGGHMPQVVTESMIDKADLVLGMAREHVRAVVAMVPEAWPRSFTLKELVRRARHAGGRPAGTGVFEFVRSLGRDRITIDLLGQSADDDVSDPMGEGPDAVARVADEIDALVADLTGLVWLPRSDRITPGLQESRESDDVSLSPQHARPGGRRCRRAAR